MVTTEQQKNATFSQIVFDHVHDGSQVLDLGAGDGRWSKKFTLAGAVVTAVDQRPPKESISGVEWEIQDAVIYIEYLESRAQFDIAFLRNVIQFFDWEQTINVVLPKLKSHIALGGIIAIQTFFAQPRPPFPKPVSALYQLHDLLPVFSDWKILWQEEKKHRGPDLAGQEREFSISEVIVQRPPHDS